VAQRAAVPGRRRHWHDQSWTSSHHRWFTVLVAVLSPVVLFRWHISHPVLVAVAALVGLITSPLLQPAWVLVK
jgi:hypothetical protein